MTEYTEAISKRTWGKLRRQVLWLFVILAIGLAALFIGVINFAWGESFEQWLWELLFSLLFLGIALVVSLVFIDRQEKRNRAFINKVFERELAEVRTVRSRYEALQGMAAVVSATLEIDRILDTGQDVFELRLAELGIPPAKQVSAVLLFEGGELTVTASRNLTELDRETKLPGNQGLLGQALKHGEPAISRQVKEDPELKRLVAFQACQTALALPLRAGFQAFGLIVVGSQDEIKLAEEDVLLFSSVADLTVAVLQNAQLHLEHRQDKATVTTAEEAERSALAHALRDGPAQRVASAALRLGFIHGMLLKSPDQALIELKKVEASTRQSAEELREIAFLLRPMDSKNRAFSAAMTNVVQRANEVSGLEVQLTGSEHGRFLSDDGQRITPYIIEEALFQAHKYGNASQAAVRLWRENDYFIARIEDNGRNYDTLLAPGESRSVQDLGIVYMRERAKRFGASLEVKPGAAGGRMTTLIAPAEPDAR